MLAVRTESKAYIYSSVMASLSPHTKVPMRCNITAFNRDAGTGRVKFTVCVEFEDQEWRVAR